MARRQTTAVTIISKISQKPVRRAAALVVIHGDDLGRKLDLSSEAITIGRSSANDIQVDQDAVSRKHAVIAHDGGKHTVRDLGSTNGTIVNDEHIEGVTRRHRSLRYPD